MSVFFNPDNWFWRGFGRIADYFILSVLWMVCCVPLVTAGAATIALYDAAAHSFRFHEADMVRRFFRTFRQELLRGILLTLLWAAACFLLNMGYQIICQLGDGNTFWTVLSIVYFVTLFIPLGVICWAVALQSRFTHGFGGLHKTALVFTFAYLPHTAAIVVIFVLVLNVILNFPFLVIFLPAATAHLQSLFIEKVFKKYMPDDDALPTE